MAGSTGHGADRSWDEDLQKHSKDTTSRVLNSTGVSYLYTPDLSVSVSSPKAKITVLRCRRKVTTTYPSTSRRQTVATRIEDKEIDSRQTILRPEDVGPKGQHRHHLAHTTASTSRRLVYKVRTAPVSFAPLETGGKDESAQSGRHAEPDLSSEDTTNQPPQADEQRELPANDMSLAAFGSNGEQVLIEGGSNHRPPAVSEG